MSHTQILQLSLVVGSAFFFFGTIFGILVISYGKNGLFEISDGLKAERADNETLREFIVKIIPDVPLSSFIRAGGKAVIENQLRKVAVSFPALEATSAGPDTALRAGDPSSDWDCGEQGHRYGIKNVDGEVKRLCLHCPHDGGSAA